MTTIDDFIPLSDLTNRGVYRIKCRNLQFGVYREETKGFIGIREKFGHKYLFEEYHYDTGAPFGTVRPIEFVVELPSGIELREYLPTECKTCGRPVVFVRDNPLSAESRGVWVHDTDRDCDNPVPVSRQYRPLFKFLQNVEEVLTK